MDAIDRPWSLDQLLAERSLWLRGDADGEASGTPVWYVWHDGRVWICTNSGSARSGLAHAGASVTLGVDGGAGKLEGCGPPTLHPRPYPAAVVAAFKAKFGWDLDCSDGGEEGPLDELWSISVPTWHGVV